MSNYKEQKNNKPQTADVINAVLKDGRKQDALDFLDFIVSLKLNYRPLKRAGLRKAD